MKNKVIIFCLAFILVITANASALAASVYPVYESASGYQQLFDNISFSDIGRNEAKKQIYKMSAFSIYRGMGNSAFNPNANVTREQALFLILRLVGLEEEAQKKGAELDKKPDTAGISIIPSFDYWAMGAVEIAKKYKILLPEEAALITSLGETVQESMDNEISEAIDSYSQNPNLSAKQIKNIEALLKQKIQTRYTWKQNVSREQALVWLARAIKIAPVQDQSQQMIYTLRDWSSMDAASLPLIEALLQKDIVQSNSNGYLNPKSSISRADMAKALDAAFETTLQDRKYRVIKGTVVKVQDSVASSKGTTKGDLTPQRLRTFTVKNIDLQPSYVNIVTRSNERGTLQTGFILFKDGTIVPANTLEYGDTVLYYLDKSNKVVYAEITQE